MYIYFYLEKIYIKSLIWASIKFLQEQKKDAKKIKRSTKTRTIKTAIFSKQVNHSITNHAVSLYEPSLSRMGKNQNGTNLSPKPANMYIDNFIHKQSPLKL